MNFEEKITRAMQGSGGGGSYDDTAIKASVASLSSSLAGLLYKAPTISLSSVPAGAIYKYGQSVASTVLNLAINKQTNNITQVIYKKNGAVIKTNSSPNSISDTFTDSIAIVDTTTYLATANDSTTTVTSNSIVFSFVYQMFQGGVAKTITTPVSADIKALTTLVQTKQNITQAYTLVDKKAVFAYPTSYGNLTSIIDVNGFNILPSYTLTTLSLVMDDAKAVSYNVYTMTNSVTVTGFNITYKF